jgi:spore cortex formation protein SpoVR/YcgB (stage V sporulation)
MIFIDKNILFGYANKKMFGELQPEYTLKLVELITQNKLTACLHESTIFALSNYIKFKLKRPKHQGGQELLEQEADKKSREFCLEIFNEPWKVVSLKKQDIVTALKDKEFNFEDSIQYYAFIESKAEYLVTWNTKDFLKAGKKLKNPKEILIQIKKDKEE